MPWMDIISAFCTLTAKRNSPELFRKWAAIGMVASACERRIWTKISQDRLFANLWVLLVGPPGVGKTQAIMQTENLLRAGKLINIAPGNMNGASMLDALANKPKTLKLAGKIETYHSLFIAAKEFGVFLPEYDRTFMQILNDIFDNPPEVSVQRIGRGKETFTVEHPQLSILAGTTPSYLGEFMPEHAWSGGFTARFLMIYANQGPKQELFQSHANDQLLEANLISQISDIQRLQGYMQWEQSAVNELIRWYRAGMDPAPTHSKLEHYLNRRHMFLTKLAMICTLSRTGKMVIGLEDLTRAKDLLFEAETLIPDIFRDMVGKSDGAIIQELHFFMNRIYANQPLGQKKSVPSKLVYRFLQDRIPSEKVEKVLDIATRSDVIAVAQDGSGGYVPRPNMGLWNVDL